MLLIENCTKVALVLLVLLPTGRIAGAVLRLSDIELQPAHRLLGQGIRSNLTRFSSEQCVDIHPQAIVNQQSEIDFRIYPLFSETELSLSGNTAIISKAEGLIRQAAANLGYSEAHVSGIVIKTSLARTLSILEHERYTPKGKKINIYDLAIQGTHVYVALGELGVAAFDVSVPTKIKMLWIYGEQPAYSIKVIDKLVYITAGKHGIYVLEQSDSQKPEIRSWYEKLLADSLSIVGNYGLVITRGEKLTVVDLSDPDQLGILGVLALPGIQAMDYAEKTVYTARGALGISTVDLSDPSRPAIIHDYPQYPADKVIYRDKRIYFIEAIEGFSIADLSLPDLPNKLGNLKAAELTNDFVLLENTVLLGTKGDSSFVAVDISDPHEPFILSHSAKFPAKNIYLHQNFLLVSTNSTLNFIDITDIENVKILASAELGDYLSHPIPAVTLNVRAKRALSHNLATFFHTCGTEYVNTLKTRDRSFIVIGFISIYEAAASKIREDIAIHLNKFKNKSHSMPTTSISILSDIIDNRKPDFSVLGMSDKILNSQGVLVNRFVKTDEITKLIAEGYRDLLVRKPVGVESVYTASWAQGFRKIKLMCSKPENSKICRRRFRFQLTKLFNDLKKVQRIYQKASYIQRANPPDLQAYVLRQANECLTRINRSSQSLLWSQFDLCAEKYQSSNQSFISGIIECEQLTLAIENVLLMSACQAISQRFLDNIPFLARQSETLISISQRQQLKTDYSLGESFYLESPLPEPPCLTVNKQKTLSKQYAVFETLGPRGGEHQEGSQQFDLQLNISERNLPVGFTPAKDSPLISLLGVLRNTKTGLREPFSPGNEDGEREFLARKEQLDNLGQFFKKCGSHFLQEYSATKKIDLVIEVATNELDDSNHGDATLFNAIRMDMVANVEGIMPGRESFYLEYEKPLKNQGELIESLIHEKPYGSYQLVYYRSWYHFFNRREFVNMLRIEPCALTEMDIFNTDRCVSEIQYLINILN